MNQAASFDDVLARLRQRDERAAAEVFGRFHSRLIGLARHHLDGRLRRKIDPDDVVQSVFQSVFRRLTAEQFSLATWDSLWGLLTCVTVRKCGKWRDHYRTKGRDVGRETPPIAEDDAVCGLEVLDRQPSPEEGVTLAETVEQVLRGLAEHERQIVLLSLEGYAVPEVSTAAGCTDSKVYRVLRLIRGRLERMCEEAG